MGPTRINFGNSQTITALKGSSFPLAGTLRLEEFIRDSDSLHRGFCAVPVHGKEFRDRTTRFGRVEPSTGGHLEIAPRELRSVLTVAANPMHLR